MPLAVFALTAAAFGIGTTEFVIMGLLPQVAASLGVSISAAGQLVTGYALGVVVGAPALTLATARMGRKPLLLLLAAVFTLGNLLCAVAPDYWTLMAARVVTAFSHGAFFGAGSIVAGRLAPPGRSAAAIAAMFLGATVANIIGVPAGTWIGQHLGWRAPFWAIAVIGALAATAIATLIPAARAGGGTGSMAAELRVAVRPAVLAGLAVTALGYAGTFTAFTYVAPMLTDLAGYAPSNVPTVLVLFGVGLIGGNWLGGWAADRALMPAVLGSLAVLAVSLAAMGVLVHSQAGAAVSVALLGAAAFGTVAPLQTFVVRAAVGGEGLASALNIGAFNLGNAGGAWLGGVVLDHGGGLAPIPFWAAGVTVVGLLVAMAAAPP